MTSKPSKPTPPGEVLLEAFMKPYHVDQNELSEKLKVSRRRVNEIINGKRSITADTAIRLAKLFSTTPQYWMNLQMQFDLWQTSHDRNLTKVILDIEEIA